MKLYGLIESYQDYKGADATNWGVKKTLEDAKKDLIDILEQQFHYIRENIICEIWEETEEEGEIDNEAIEARWKEWVEDHLEEGSYEKGYSYKWEYDDGDCVYKFYIDELEL